jgi:hypothetical protein
VQPARLPDRERLELPPAHGGAPAGTHARPGAEAEPNFSHDVRGWSGDFALNEGRKMMVLGCQLEYRKRYFVELSYMGVWGGDYNSVIDRDAVSLSAGLRF